MSWRLKTWSPELESIVTILLHQGSESTELKLTQKNVPIGEKNAVEQNWNNYFWNSIKRTFGLGAML
jgi:activator of HSP90 ATPase